MKKIIGLIILTFTSLSYGQSFEGKLTYKVDFKYNMDDYHMLSEKQLIEQRKQSGEYFDTIVISIKNGNYEKLINSVNLTRLVYKSDVNKIYAFVKDDKHLLITNAKNYGYLETDFGGRPRIIKNDSVVKIRGRNCKSITLSWNDYGYGQETYFYDESFLPIDSELFKSHHYEYLNEVLNSTKSYPIKIITSLTPSLEIRMTLVNHSEEKISDLAFKIPELKPAGMEYIKRIKATNAADEVMLIGN